MIITEKSQNKPVPQSVAIPDDLREFLEVVHILTGGLENGTYQLNEPEDCLYWGEITWSSAGVFRTRMIGYPDEKLAEFEFKYLPPLHHGEWEFVLSREMLAQIASGEVNHLLLCGCANPVCGYMSSSGQDQCPRCNLEAGANIRDVRSQRVLGICPYCQEALRSLYAEQCRHCLMDWHDAEHPTKLGTKA